MSSALDRLADARSLTREPWDPGEFAGLRQSGLARLTDAANTNNSLIGRFDLAYNASHALALAALRYHGFRPTNRYIVFQALPHSLGVGPEVWRILAKAHDMRNVAEYEGQIDVDETLVDGLIQACSKVADRLGELPDKQP